MSCHAQETSCVPVVIPQRPDHFTLRIAAVRFNRPFSLQWGLLAQPLFDAVTPAQPLCNLRGTSGWNWLLSFDLASSTVTLGGARAVHSPEVPYAWVSEVFHDASGTDFPVAPVSASTSLNAACGFTASFPDVVVPAFMDAAATTVTLLPLRQPTITTGILSADHACMGAFNVLNLDPGTQCMQTPQTPAFTAGAILNAFILLEDADQVTVTSLNQSLCVALAQDATTYGTPTASGVVRCTRGGDGKILFPGDWCAATNLDATPSCADAVGWSTMLSASAVNGP